MRLRLCLLTACFGVLAAVGGVPAPAANAADCSDVEVVFARGTGDAPGVGEVGQAFVDSLRAKVGGRSVGVYAVNYPATMNFLQAADGAADATGHVQWLTANCPASRIVLGGFSQGAVVVDLALGVSPVVAGIPGLPGLDAVPGVNLAGLTAALPPDAADHVAAVAVFGNPLGKVKGSLNQLAPAYGGRTIDLCNAGDPICGKGDLSNDAAHHQYAPARTDEAAAFVAGLV
jgi:cutinase